VPAERFARLLAESRNYLRTKLQADRKVEEAARELSRFFNWAADKAADEADAGAEEGFDDPSSVDKLRMRRREQFDQMQEALRSGFVGALRAVQPGVQPPLSGQGAPGPAGDSDDPGRQRDQGRFFGLSLPSLGGPPPRPEAPPPPPPPQVNVDRLLAAMDGAFASADRVLEAAVPLPPVRVKTTWAEDAELMELCQDLLRARLTDDRELAFSHIERLLRWLPTRHGIAVIEDWDENDSHFRVVLSDDPVVTEPRVERPALVLSDGSAIVRRGEVLLPAPVSPAAAAASVEVPPVFLSTADEDAGDE
jgi:hypothetical protein